MSYKIKHELHAVIYPDLPCTHNEHGVYRPADVSPLKYSLRLRLRSRNIAKQNNKFSFNYFSIIRPTSNRKQ